MKILKSAFDYYSSGTKCLNLISPILDLVLRIWVAKIFFQSGLTKIQSWDTTLMLFEYEYNVPILSPGLAAFLATGTELVLPILLFIGFLSRPVALVLFIFNIIAAASCPDISAAGVKDHMMWGIMLSITLIHGPGIISFDHWLCLKFHKQIQP